METSKAIKLIKNYVRHDIFIDNLYDIGLTPDNWLLDKTGLCTIIFDVDEKRKDIDEVLTTFSSNSDKLRGQVKNFHEQIPDELLTSTAIDIYMEWKAFSERQQIKA